MKIDFKYLWLLLFLPSLAWANAARLTHIQVADAESKTHLEFFLTKPVQYHVFTLANPNRLVLDFKDTKLNTELRNLQFNKQELGHVRSGYPTPSTLRLVIDLNSDIRFTSYLQSEKLMLDIYSGAQHKSVSPAPASSMQSPPSMQPSSLSPTIVANTKMRKILVIVIDPGHGGKDPGAIGEKGTKEKNVVLAISLRLAELINMQGNMRAVLTRNGDYFVPLRQRLKLARKGKADLFIAIHADSYMNDQSTGASVYALSRRGATSEAARWLAQRDNYSELGGVDLGELGDKSYVLRSVLIDLAQTATTTDSLRLGTSILDALDEVTNLHFSRVEQAPFVVLKSPDIPSILVETGFLSNPREETKLRDERYQNKMAHALLNGIRIYIQKYGI